MFIGKIRCEMDERDYDVLKKRGENVSGALFLIGLGLIFLLNLGIWPWILVLIAITGLAEELFSGRPANGIQTLLWMGGLFVMFQYNLWWPGILIMIGISMLIGALFNPEFAGGEKAKRKKRTPEGLVDVEDDEMYWKERP